MCRKHHGALFATYVAAPLAGFRWIRGEDDVSTYVSSPDGKRSFCRICGSVAPIMVEAMGMASLPAGNLEGDLGIEPQMHIFVGSKAPWYEITDSLPQHAEFPKGYDAPPILRPKVAHKDGVIQGSCLCGEVAFELDGPARRMYNCHCSRCRRGRSAAHATNVFFDLPALHWVRGESQAVEFALPGARFFGASFCRNCGGALPRPSRARNLAVVPAGSLDDDPMMRPAAHIFVGSKASWFEITDQIPQFAEMPPG
jgi:hypothetical protein